MRKVDVELVAIKDEDTGVLILCPATGSHCSPDCAAYSEGMDYTADRRQFKVAKCNAFKFTIGEL